MLNEVLARAINPLPLTVQARKPLLEVVADKLELDLDRVELDEKRLARLDERNAELVARADRGEVKLKPTVAARDEQLYKEPGFRERANKAISSWVWGGKGLKAWREAYDKLFTRGEKPATPFEETVVELAATREQRWDRLATREGLPRPSGFNLYRGVRGEYAVEEVVKAWSEPRPTMEVPLLPVTSWSTHLGQAQRFGDAPDSVIYHAHVPFEHTLGDEWVDGGAFVKLTQDQSEVMVGKPKDGLHIPVQDVQVRFRGKRYGYEQRAELLAAWQATR